MKIKDAIAKAHAHPEVLAAEADATFHRRQAQVYFDLANEANAVASAAAKRAFNVTFDLVRVYQEEEDGVATTEDLTKEVEA